MADSFTWSEAEYLKVLMGSLKTSMVCEFIYLKIRFDTKKPSSQERLLSALKD
jgi:hypothetical protein